MNVNPIQLINLIKQGNNPQQLLMSILKKNSLNNPVLENATLLANKGDIGALEALARNLANQKGLDFDTEFNNFKNLLK